MNEKLIPKAEYDRLNLELKKTQDELRRVQSTVSAAEDENSKLHQKLAELQKDKQDETSKLAQQQRGLVRRINYLIQEKEKTEQETKERNAYVAKLELKLVQQELCIKGLRSRTQSTVKPQELDGSFGLKKQTADVAAKVQATYGKIHAKQEKKGPQPNSKVKSTVSPHSYNPVASNIPDTKVNVNLTEAFKTASYGEQETDRASPEEEVLQNELFGDDVEQANPEQGDGGQRMHSSLLDELLQHSTRLDSKTVLQKMQMRINNLEENLASNRQELVSSSIKTGFNYAFDDDLEIAKSDAPRRYIRSDCFDADSCMNTSYKTHD